MRCATPLVLITLVWCPVALADNQRDCALHADSAIRITSCSQTIQDQPLNASAYLNRGSAFYANGDLDRALADYSKVIELNPNYAAAYDKRGAVYAAKGDYVHAFADVMRASELSKPPRTSGSRTKATAKAHARNGTIPVKAGLGPLQELTVVEPHVTSLSSPN